MKIIRFLYKDTGRPITAIDCEDGTALPLQGTALDPLEPIGDPITIPSQLLHPIEARCIMGIGMNYALHAREQGKEPPTRPVMFMKNPAALCGPTDDIVIPDVCRDPQQVDFECELAVIIGRTACNVPAKHALSYILGYCAANDVSARWWQKSAGGGQFNRGKSFDTFCPMGPAIITPDEIPNPQSLRLTTHVNGNLMQDSNTSDMIFSVAELIAFLSQGTTLLPGTIILTGTPSGVGFARDPQVWLKDNDQVEVEVEKIGKLNNCVRYASD